MKNITDITIAYTDPVISEEEVKLLNEVFHNQWRILSFFHEKEFYNGFIIYGTLLEREKSMIFIGPTHTLKGKRGIFLIKNISPKDIKEKGVSSFNFERHIDQHFLYLESAVKHYYSKFESIIDYNFEW